MSCLCSLSHKGGIAVKPEFNFNSDMSESPSYNIGDIPISCIYGPNAFHPCHWHPDLQFVYALAGERTIYVNGESVRILEGQGLFINSRRLHYCISSETPHSETLTVLLHPSLFAAVSETAKEYTVKKFSPKSEDYIILSPGTDWESRMLDRLTDIRIEMSKEKPNPIRLISIGNSVIADICDKIADRGTRELDEHMQITLLKMTDYLADNYPHDISVEDVAKAGSVSRSQCSRLFQRILHESPAEYLRKLRIEKSMELLRNTNLPITEIGLSCGIPSSSHFISIFKRETGLTPMGYRKQFRKTISAE